MFKQLAGSIALLALPTLALANDYRTVDQPRQECWNEQVAGQGGNPGAALIGGIAGGLLGNTVGGGNGRTAATAVGAVTGALVGDRGWGGASVQTVQRCRTVVDRVQVPVRHEPATIYVQPSPVYVQPQPVVRSAPVLVQQEYYVTPGVPVYRDGYRSEWQRDQWRHEHWRREREREREREIWEAQRRHEWRERHRRGWDDDR